MNGSINHPLKLNKRSKSNKASIWYGDANHFYDKILRIMFIVLLCAIDLVMFVYSINGKLFEDGILNQVVIYILGAVFVVSFVLILLLSFSRDLQNAICGIIAMLIIVAFFNQFAMFNVDTFIEDWLKKEASWISFIALLPSAWFIGLLVGWLIFFAFRFTSVMIFINAILLCSFLIGVSNNEKIKGSNSEYEVVKNFNSNLKGKINNNIIYFMVPELPSYHFLSNVRIDEFRELRNMLVGFYAVNGFEVYPNAFVQKDDAVSNIIDIYNQVNYLSSSSLNRGYAEILNNWNFIHGSLDYYSLEDNVLYDALKSENGYNISTYSSPGFNLCIKGDNMITDRCVVKSYKTVPLYDKNSSLEKNIYAFLSEWIFSLKSRNLKSVGKMLADMSHLKDIKVTSENRRVSIEGATKIFDEVINDYSKDANGHVYMVFVDLPSNIYIYDEYCNIKPRSQWVAQKDNSIKSVGIDEKRKAYADQTKCLIGKMQEFMDVVVKNKKIKNTDIIIQGVSGIRELSDMQAGQYSNFVKDRLVNLGIRKGNKPQFLINANICLASDFTKTMMRYQEFCYTIDDMKMRADDALSLKQNLINNSVIRGNRISNIVVNYSDWYEQYKSMSNDYIQREKKRQNDLKRRVYNANISEKFKKDAISMHQRANPIKKDNIYVPTDDLIFNDDDLSEVEVETDKVKDMSNGEISDFVDMELMQHAPIEVEKSVNENKKENVEIKKEEVVEVISSITEVDEIGDSEVENLPDDMVEIK